MTNNNRNVLDDIVIETSSESSTTLGEAIAGWGQAVTTVQRGVDRDPTYTLDVYTEHDYVGFLYWRELIEETVSKIQEDAQKIAKESLCEADLLFSEATEDGNAAQVNFLTFGSRKSESWWWKRIPKDGLVREELDLISEPDTNIP